MEEVIYSKEPSSNDDVIAASKIPYQLSSLPNHRLQFPICGGTC